MADHNPKHFARNLRRLIDWADRSVPDLAEEVGLPKSTLHRWCSAGLKQIDRKTELAFAKLAELLGMPHLQYDNSEMWKETPEWERRMEVQRKLYSHMQFVRCRAPEHFAGSENDISRFTVLMNRVNKPHEMLKIMRDADEVVRQLKLIDQAMWEFFENRIRKNDGSPLAFVTRLLHQVESTSTAVDFIVQECAKKGYTPVDLADAAQDSPAPTSVLPQEAAEPVEQVLHALGNDLRVWFDNQADAASLSVEALARLGLQRSGGDVLATISTMEGYAKSMGYKS